MTGRSIRETVRAAAGQLAEAGIDTAALDAEVLMRSLLGVDRTAYFLRRDEPVSAGIDASFGELIRERLKRIPVAYLVGEREFLGFTFAVGPGVLVPRPETELLVEWASRWLAGRRDCIAVDIGTGSGAIAIGLARIVPESTLRGIIAIDASLEALDWANRNRQQLAPDRSIAFVRGYLADMLTGPVDLVLANLPYLQPEELGENPDLAAEPVQALVSGADGLDLIRELVVDLPRFLGSAGAAILEMAPWQTAQIATHASRFLPDARINVLQDLAGLDRFVTIERGKSSE